MTQNLVEDVVPGDSSAFATDPAAVAGFAPELRETLVRKAAELRPLLTKHAKFVDENRKIHPETIEALKESGIFRLWLPKRYGGLEGDMRTHIDVTRELARSCASTAWVVGLLTSCNFNVALLSEQAQDDVFGPDPDARVCGALDAAGEARKVTGGYMLEGRWAVASGSLHADWAILAAPLVDEDGSLINAGFMVAPMSDLEVLDTWFTVGMRGTGSNAIAARGIFVPEHRVLELLGSDGFIDNKASTSDEVLYRVKLGSMASLAEIGTQLGLGMSAVELAREQIAKRKISYTVYERQIDAASTQLDLARAATMIDAAHLLTYRAAADADGAAAAGQELDLTVRTRLRADCSYASYTVRQAVDMIMMMCGAGGMGQSNQLSLVWRDLSTVTLHALLRPSVTDELYGRVLCGLPPAISPVV